MKPTVAGAQGAAALLALGVVGFLAWRAWRTGSSLAVSARQAYEEAAARVTDTVNTLGNAFDQGRRYAETGEVPQRTIKDILFGGVEYDGIDPATGVPVIAGEWYGDEEARRYEAEQRASGYSPPATSINGAAFGIYPGATRNPWATARTPGDFARMDRLYDQRATSSGNY